ncbi:MAG: hypothetical protein ACOYMR_07120 [Ilumatobacteraceae bacterium]
MDARFRSIAATAARQCSVISVSQLAHTGVDSSLRLKWERRGLLERVGVRTFVMAGAEPSWLQSLFITYLDGEGEAFIAGRSACRLMRLDGFEDGPAESLVPRELRKKAMSGVVRSTARAIPPTDLQWINGLRVLRAERAIIDAPLFGFDQAEVENAIDSAIRLRLVSEQRLRTRVVAEHRSGVNGSRVLLDALVDTGGESRLERWFLRLCREGGLDRPVTQRVYREGSRVIARVDAEFPGDLIVEVAGHGTHATRRQIQQDEERRTRLTLKGKRVIVFTYNDVRDRPKWVASQIRKALLLAA